MLHQDLRLPEHQQDLRAQQALLALAAQLVQLVRYHQQPLWARLDPLDPVDLVDRSALYFPLGQFDPQVQLVLQAPALLPNQ